MGLDMKTRKTILQRFVCLICILPLLLAGCQVASTSQSTEAAATPTPPSTAAASPTQDSSTATTQPGGVPPDGGQPGGQPGDVSGAPDNGSVHSTAAIYIDNGSRDSSKEYTGGSVTVADAGTIGDSAASGVLLTSDSYDATGLVVTNGSTYTLGGDSDTYSVYSDVSKNYLGTGTTSASGGDLLGTFDSVLIFGLDSDVDASATTGSSGIDVGSGSMLKLNKVFVQVDGARRFAVSNYNDGTLIVNDSTLITTGDADGYTSQISAPFSNEHLLISGLSRTNFSTGATETYYYNSNVIAEGWAALSTDSATGGGLDLYAYNTKASALDGGYGTYADTNCRVWLYGSDLTSAEIGAIIAKTGTITVADGSAASSDLLANNTGATTTSGSTITGGRNAVMIHAPDMMGEGVRAASIGVLTVSNSTLATSDTLTSTYDYATYGAAAKAYVDYVSGDVILVKSTSANISLTNTELDSYHGVLIHTVLNNDSMGNFLKAGEDTSVKPVSVTLKDMNASGNILHDDYQRDVQLTLDNTALTGSIEQGTYDSWKALWAAKNVTSADWLKDTSWDGTNSLAVTLENGSSWIVTEDSTLTSLTIGDNSTVSAPNGKTLVMTVDGKETPIQSGTYTGTIVIAVN
jgi:hypothetical protein